MSLQHKTAVITGASSGIGRAIANSLAQEGMHVYITGQNAERLEAVCTQIYSKGGRATAQAFDIRDIEKLQDFVRQAKEQTGRLDVMVNNAGVNIPGPIADGDPESWRTMLDVNILALLAGSQAAIRAMRQNTDGAGGHIVNISSATAKSPGRDVYGSTKHMVNALCEALTKELADEPIRVTNIMPGAVATNLGRNYDPAFINGIAQQLGAKIDFKQGDHLPDQLIEGLHAGMGQLFLGAEDVARAVIYALMQPQNADVREIYLRTPKELAL